MEDATRLISDGPYVLIVKLDAKNSAPRLKLEAWSAGNGIWSAGNRIEWVLVSQCSELLPPTPNQDSSRKSVARISDANVIEATDGLRRPHVLVSYNGGSRLYQIKLIHRARKKLSGGASGGASGPHRKITAEDSPLFLFVDLGTIPEFHPGCRLLDGPSVMALQRDRLLFFDVGSKNYYNSSSLSKGLKEISGLPGSDSGKLRLCVAEKIDNEDAFFLVVVSGSEVIVADVFVIHDKVLRPLSRPLSSSSTSSSSSFSSLIPSSSSISSSFASSSSVEAIPRIFRKSLVSLMVLKMELSEIERTFKCDFIIFTTQKSIFHLRDGSVIGHAPVGGLARASVDHFDWLRVDCASGDRLICWNGTSGGEVSVFVGDSLKRDDAGASAVAAQLAEVDDFRLTTSYVAGKETPCVYGNRDGVLTLTSCAFSIPENNNTMTAKITPPKTIREGTKMAFIGFRNVVQTATSAMESEERRLNDKAEMIRTLLRHLEGSRVVDGDCKIRDQFRLTAKRGPCDVDVDDQTNVIQSEKRTYDGSFISALQASVNNHVVELFHPNPPLTGRNLFAIAARRLGKTPFHCQLHFRFSDSSSSSESVMAVIQNPIVSDVDLNYSLINASSPSSSFHRIASSRVNLTAIQPLSLSSPSTKFSSTTEFIWALERLKIHASLTLVSAEVDLPSNHFLFCEKLGMMEQRRLADVSSRAPHPTASISSRELYSMEQPLSPLFGCVVIVDSGPGSDVSFRESRFRLFADSPAQFSIALQRLYEAAPEGCLIVTERQFRRRFVEKRTMEEITSIVQNYVRERREAYRKLLRNDDLVSSGNILRKEMEKKLTDSLKIDNTGSDDEKSRAMSDVDVGLLVDRISDRFDSTLLSLIVSLDTLR